MPAPKRSHADAGGPEAGGGVQSVDRAITILELLSRRGAVGVSEVAIEIGVHKSTASRLLGALVERDLVEQVGDRGKYQLGFGILRLAGAIPNRLDLVRQARPVLDELVTRFGETVNLAVISSHYAVNVDQAMSPAAIASQNWVGQLTPLHATSSGKVLLAHLDEPDRSRLLTAAGLARFTRATITTRKALASQLAAVPDDGYATTFEEYEDGLNAVAAPVRDHSAAVVAAVSVSGPAYRFDAARIDEIVAELRQGADRISERMLYRP
jgi:DNA-binding IclR family transcriptional regulator